MMNLLNGPLQGKQHKKSKQYTLPLNDRFTARRLGHLHNSLLKSHSHLIEDQTYIVKKILGIPNFRERTEEMFSLVTLIITFNRKTLPKIEELIMGIYIEFIEDVSVFLGHNDILKFKAEEENDWSQKGRKSAFMNTMKNHMKDIDAIYLDNMQDEEIKEILYNNLYTIYLHTGALMNRISIFLTYLINSKKLRKMVLQSGYINFLDVIINESIDESYEAMRLFNKEYRLRFIQYIAQEARANPELKDEILDVLGLETEKVKTQKYVVAPVKKTFLGKCLCCFNMKKKGQKDVPDRSLRISSKLQKQEDMGLIDLKKLEAQKSKEAKQKFLAEIKENQFKHNLDTFIVSQVNGSFINLMARLSKYSPC